MRVLYLSPMVPHPTNDGGRQRLHHLLTALLDEHDVTFAATSSDAEQFSDWPLASRLAAAPLVVPRNLPSAGSRGAPASSLLTPSFVRRVYQSAFWDRLSALPLRDFDVVHVEYASLAAYGPAIKALNPRVRLVLDAHNVEWLVRARSASAPPWWWLQRRHVGRMLDALRWYWFEKNTLTLYDCVLACSEEDRARLSGWIDPAKVHVVPNCADLSAPQLPPPPPGSKDLVFVGSMSYRPNVEGVDFFCRSVWPRVRAAEPAARFWIVGKGASDETRALATDGNGIHVTGLVPDVRPFLERAVGSVVPLLSGSGTRLKILESFAAGRAVLSTSIGAEGIDAVGGQEILYADTADALVDGCLILLRSEQVRDQIAASGRQLADRKYDWRHAQGRVLELYRQLGAGAPAPHPGAQRVQ